MPVKNKEITINDIIYVISNLHYIKNKIFPIHTACINNKQALVQLTEHLMLMLNINKHNILEIIIKECDYITKLDSICITTSYIDDLGDININLLKTVYERILREWV